MSLVETIQTSKWQSYGVGFVLDAKTIAKNSMVLHSQMSVFNLGSPKHQLYLFLQKV